MGKSVTIELPDDVYAALHEIEASTGRPMVELASEWVLRYSPRPQGRNSGSDKPQQHQLHKYAGAANSGDPHSGDNDRIDADLAREYLNIDRGPH